MAISPAAALLISAGAGLASNVVAENRRQAAQRQQEALRRPAIDFFQGVLDDPQAGIENLGGLRSNLEGRVTSRIEEAIARARERAEESAVRRGRFGSGLLGESLRDIEERGFETLADQQASIDQFVTNLINQRQQAAAAALANPSLTDPRAAGLASGASAFQQFGNQLLAPSVGTLADRFLQLAGLGAGNLFQPQPTAALDTSGLFNLATSFGNQSRVPGSIRPIQRAPRLGASRGFRNF